MSALARALALLLSILILPVQAWAFGLTDPTGRRVMIDAPPRRIVSLVPSVTELLFAIGAQDLLVGVTDFCDYPAAARQKPRVGGMLAPSLETLVALKPDLVVATTAGNREETFTQLERLRMPVYVVNPTSVADVLDLISRLGTVTGRESAAGRLAVSLRGRLDRRVGARDDAAAPAGAVRSLARSAHRARARRARDRAARAGGR